MGFNTLTEYAGYPGETQYINYGAADEAAFNSAELLQEKGKAAQLENQQHIYEISHKFDKDGKGTVTFKASDQAAEALQQYIAIGQKASAIAQERARILEERRRTLEQHPILAGVGRLAALAAAGYSGQDRVGPIIRAAGVYGGEYFGKTTDELAAEEQSVRSEEIRSQAPIMGAVEAQARTELGKAELGQRGKEFDERERDRKLSRGIRIRQDYEAIARARRLPENVEQLLRNEQDLDPAEIPAMVEGLRSIQAQAQEDYKDKERERKDAAELHKAQVNAYVAQKNASLTEVKTAKTLPFVTALGKLNEEEGKLVIATEENRNLIERAAADVGLPAPQVNADGTISVKEAERVLQGFGAATRVGGAYRKKYGFVPDEQAEKEREAEIGRLTKAVGHMATVNEAEKRLVKQRAPLVTALRKIDPDTAAAQESGIPVEVKKPGAKAVPKRKLTPEEEASQYLNGTTGTDRY